MKRHQALYTLSHDHHQGLILAQQLKKNAPQYKGMPSTLAGKKEYTQTFYKSELVKHFEDEEQILFPMVNGKSDNVDNIIADVILEHRKMELLVRQLAKTDKLEDLLDELGILLEKHIRKEERELFVEVEKVLTDEELKIISDSISKSRTQI